MRAPHIVALALLVASSGLRAQEPTIEVETHLVTMTFSVRNPGGNLVSGLNAEDFSLYEDGTPQKISLFPRESHLPLTLGLLVDASESQGKFLKQHLEDIQAFLTDTLQPQDQVFVIGFGNHLRLVSEVGSSSPGVVEELRRYNKNPSNFPELDPDETREGGTALYDAICAATQEKLSRATGNRKALILFTDGEENASAHDEIDAIAAAQDADTLIYAIRYTEMRHKRLTADNRHGIAALQHIAAQTGGVEFDALTSDLPRVFSRIGEELRSLYSIGYYSSNKRRDNTFRKVVIEAHTPGLVVRARSGYYAR